MSELSAFKEGIDAAVEYEWEIKCNHIDGWSAWHCDAPEPNLNNATFDQLIEWMKEIGFLE